MPVPQRVDVAEAAARIIESPVPQDARGAGIGGVVAWIDYIKQALGLPYALVAAAARVSKAQLSQYVSGRLDQSASAHAKLIALREQP